MRYLIDTDTCIAIAREKPAHVLARFQQLKPGDIGMSVVTYMELCYGARNSRVPEANFDKIARLAAVVPSIPLENSAASYYADLRVDRERTGRRIGAYDLLIAAHALALGLVLITNNTDEFSRIRGLRVENWIRPYWIRP
jgi:tRNA(fMet)-specific endonuclease VapC